jgi:hypothetical protein
VYWPVCSADRDEAYARDAMLPAVPPHPKDCTGWAGTDTDDRPRPCLTCRPWLTRRLRTGRRRVRTARR